MTQGTGNLPVRWRSSACNQLQLKAMNFSIDKRRLSATLSLRTQIHPMEWGMTPEYQAKLTELLVGLEDVYEIGAWTEAFGRHEVQAVAKPEGLR